MKYVVRAIDIKTCGETPTAGELSKVRRGGIFSERLEPINQITQGNAP
jgi:hypothetical protein